MKANYKDKLPKPTTEVTLGSLYEINKQYYAQQEPFTQDQIDTAITNITSWFETQTDKYFMLLCNERKDYTLFNLNQHYLRREEEIKARCVEVSKDIIDCMTNRGTLIDVELQEDGAYEIWVKIEDECFAYYLFPYNTGVIEY